MKKIRVLAIALIALALFASCTSAKFSGLQMTKEIPSYNVVKDFDIDITVTEFFGISGGPNLLNITSDAMDTEVFDAIQREIQKFSGDAAVNITIEQKAGLMDMVLNSVTGTIYAPVHVHVSGTIVKYGN